MLIFWCHQLVFGFTANVIMSWNRGSKICKISNRISRVEYIFYHHLNRHFLKFGINFAYLAWIQLRDLKRCATLDSCSAGNQAKTCQLIVHSAAASSRDFRKEKRNKTMATATLSRIWWPTSSERQVEWFWPSSPSYLNSERSSPPL